MDDMLAQAISKRERELNVVLKTQDTNEGNKWIHKDDPSDKHIKIGEKINEKHVTFEIKEASKTMKEEFELEEPNFLSMLKRTEPKKELSVEERLNKIENNQTNIMNILSNILKIIQSK